MRLALYCTCGASCVGTVKPDAVAERFTRNVWALHHSSPGHEPCDRQTAARARAKQDREEAKKD